MTHQAPLPHALTKEDVILPDSIRTRSDTPWHDGYQAGRAAALAELDTARAALERLYGRLADVIDMCDRETLRRRAAPPPGAALNHRSASRPVSFGHTYLVREAGDGVA
jgi:hypothetical protein